MPSEQRNLIHSVLLIGTFVFLGLVFIDQMIGNPAALS